MNLSVVSTKRCIQDTTNSELLQAEIKLVDLNELEQAFHYKGLKTVFNWSYQTQSTKHIYELSIPQDEKTNRKAEPIGLISLFNTGEGIFIDLIENLNFIEQAPKQRFKNIGIVLIGFACWFACQYSPNYLEVFWECKHGDQFIKLKNYYLNVIKAEIHTEPCGMYLSAERSILLASSLFENPNSIDYDHLF